MARYTHAVICRIPHNVQLDSQTVQAGIDLTQARREQEALCEALREAGVDVVELAPEDSAPASSLFVEDMAIVCNGTALITRPVHACRRKEALALFHELGLQVIETDPDNKKVQLEGSDVLFTGREFFVGLSKRTNEAGAQFLAGTFPEFPVTPIRVSGGSGGPTNGCLKDYIALAAPNVLAVASNDESQKILKRIERDATYRYNILTLPRLDAVNCVLLNLTVIYRNDIPEAAEKFQSLANVQTHGISMAELSKLGGTLSQHVILFRRFKLLKNL